MQHSTTANGRNECRQTEQTLDVRHYRPLDQTDSTSLTPRKGQLYTYRLIRSLPAETAADGLVVDLGFNTSRSGPIDGINDPKPGMIVTARKHRRGNAPAYRFAVNRHRGRKLYTVKAVCQRVVDGDTLLVRLDLGFHIWRTERLRLRGIDTPELYSSAGQQARDFVREALSQVPLMVVCTSIRDKYGRYLADLFYLPGASDPLDVLSDGLCLNRQLLDAGLARPYSGRA